MEFNEKELLDFGLRNDIMDIIGATLKQQIEEMERQEILAQHPYNITKAANYYSTYFPSIDGKRQYRRRRTRKEIEDLIVEYYKDKMQEIYLKDVFYEWINQKLEYNEIQRASYDRYINDYKRFFETKPNVLSVKRFKNINEDDLEAFIKVSIRDFNLSRKSYAGLRTLLYGIFRYGKKKKYTTISISQFMKDLDLPRNMFQKKVIEREKEVFMEDELPVIIKYLKEHPDIYNLGILLVFETGMRVGELAALSPNDIGDCEIKIRRTEVKYRDKSGRWLVTVKDHPKTSAGCRNLIIPPKAIKTVQSAMKLNPNGSYLFEHNGKRIRGNTFNKRLSSICKKLDIPHRTMHKIRKTYGTMLIDSEQMSDAFVAAQMGHTDISCTRRYYYFSNKSIEKNKKQIEQVISF